MGHLEEYPWSWSLAGLRNGQGNLCGKPIRLAESNSPTQIMQSYVLYSLWSTQLDKCPKANGNFAEQY